MEKHGVCRGEGEEPVAGELTKAATQDAIDAAKECCGGQKCGSDASSKLAEAAARPPKKPKDNSSV